MHDAIARRDIADIGEIVHGLADQVAVAEHRAFRPPGRAGSVEQPGRIVGLDLGHRHGRAGRELRPERAVGRHDPLQRRDLAVEPGDRFLLLAIGEADPCNAVLQNEGEFLAVQLGVDRHGADPGMPAGVFHGHVVRHVGHDNRRPVALSQAEPVHHLPGQHGDPPGEIAIIVEPPDALAERSRVRVQQGGAVKECGEVHGACPGDAV